MPSQMQSAMQSATPSFRRRSHHAVIRVYDETGDVIDTHERHVKIRRSLARP